MEASLCREHLAELVHEELKLLEILYRLLEQERAVIASGDLKALERSTAERQAQVAALAHTEAQRNSLCSLHGQSADAAGLAHILRWCDPKGTLSAPLRDCRERALKCRQLNDRNGLMVSAHLKRVDERLRALRGRTDRAATYGPRGALAGAHPGRMLGSV
jgi:flagellar biosynthesis/type III secretory pathway chaperone